MKATLVFIAMLITYVHASSQLPISYCKPGCSFEMLSSDRELEDALRGTIIDLEIDFKYGPLKKSYLLSDFGAELQYGSKQNGKEHPLTDWSVKDAELLFTNQLGFSSHPLKKQFRIDLRTLSGELVESNSNRMNRFDVRIISTSVLTKPAIAQCIECYVRSQIEKWQTKGEFEKTTDYLNRVTDQSRTEAIRNYQEEVISDFEEQTERYLDEIQNQANFATLNPYDADNETFKIDLKYMGSIFLNVPIDEAPYFKDSFSGERFMGWEVAYFEGEFRIIEVHYTFSPPKDVYDKMTWVQGENYLWGYTYNNSNAYSFGSTEVKFDFEDFEINHNQSPMVSQDNISDIRLIEVSADAEISFNQVPKDIIVETVAVMPIDGKDCNGQTVSGQDIASFTEGSLLGLYNVVERRNLERVLDEQRLALSGILYEKSVVEAGCNISAQGIIFTEYGCLSGQETIQLKLVDCQTSELYWSATGVNATAQETLNKVRQELEGEKN